MRSNHEQGKTRVVDMHVLNHYVKVEYSPVSQIPLSH